MPRYRVGTVKMPADHGSDGRRASGRHILRGVVLDLRERKNSRWWPWQLFFGVYAVWMFAAAVGGCAISFTPFPSWDLWNAYVDLRLHILSGDWPVLWAVRNEHRCFITSVLMWWDSAWFGGRNVSLFTENILIGVGEILTLWAVLKGSLGGLAWEKEDLALGLFLAGWALQWCQAENFGRADGSAMLLAPWLALASFYWLHRAAHGGAWALAAACALGIACLGTMANGLLVLPLMAVGAALMGMGWKRTAILAALALLGFLAYLNGWSHAGVRLDPWALLAHPLALADYLLLFIGSPFYFIFHQLKGVPADWVMAVAAGVALVALWSRWAWGALKDPASRTFAIAMLCYIVFFGFTACLVALGRMGNGIMVPASRYTTEGVLAWGVAFIMLHSGVRSLALADRRRRIWLGLLVILAALSARVQRHAFSNQRGQNDAYGQAALALGLNVNDPPVERASCWSPELIRGIVARAVAERVAIYGTAPWTGLAARIGTKSADGWRRNCEIDRVGPVGPGSRFVRVEGSLEGLQAWEPGAIACLRDRAGYAVGFAVPALSAPGSKARFLGYVTNGSRPASLGLAGR